MCHISGVGTCEIFRETELLRIIKFSPRIFLLTWINCELWKIILTGNSFLWVFIEFFTLTASGFLLAGVSSRLFSVLGGPAGGAGARGAWEGLAGTPSTVFLLSSREQL